MKFLLTALVLSASLTFSGSDAYAQNRAGGAADSSQELQPKPFLGIAFEMAGGKGVAIQQTIPDSPADKAGLKAGDIVLKVDGENLTSLEMLPKTFSARKVGDKVELVVQRGEKQMEISVVLGNRDDFTIELPRDGQKVEEPTTQTFESEDGLPITVDIYAPYDVSAPSILLCHQAGWSRGEYREIAPKLNAMGFNCFAIDQRSGGGVNDVVNGTNSRAMKEGKGVAFLDAEQDIVAALKHLRGKQAANKKGKLILWGSSYSAALSLRIAGEHPELVDGVLAFAPGEYFARFGKADDWVAVSAKKIAVPAFITSAKAERKNWKSIYDSIPGDSKEMFLPETKGNHGSRALWEKFDDHAAYWKATSSFLQQFLATETGLKE